METNTKNQEKVQNRKWNIVLLISQFSSIFAVIILFLCGVISINCDKKTEQHKFRVCKENGYMIVKNYHDHINEVREVKTQEVIDSQLRRKASNRLTKYFKSKWDGDKEDLKARFDPFSGMVKIYDAFFDIKKINQYIKKPKDKDDDRMKWFNNNIRENEVEISNSYFIEGKYFLRLTEDQQNLHFVMKDDFDTLRAESRKGHEKDLKDAQESKKSNKEERIKQLKEALEYFDEAWEKYVPFAKKVQDIKMPLTEMQNILTKIINSRHAKNASIDSVCIVKIGDGISICFLNSKLEREHYDDDGNLLSKSTVLDEFKKFNFEIIWQTSAK